MSGFEKGKEISKRIFKKISVSYLKKCLQKSINCRKKFSIGCAESKSERL
jgi:hypothetical protein